MAGVYRQQAVDKKGGRSVIFFMLLFAIAWTFIVDGAKWALMYEDVF